MSLRLAVFASGSGTTLQNLIDRSQEGRLDASVVVVISDQEKAKALDRARAVNVPAHYLPYRLKEVSKYSHEAFEICRQVKADLVVLAGFLKLIHIPQDFVGHVINVHPSLIPAFCGKGCYGHHVHEAAIERGVKVSGCTVHYCDNEYDHGPIILQQVVEVTSEDDADSLATKVQAAEREALPEAIQLISQGRVTLHGRKAIVHRS
ncbi:phosphoribosylglycinamide formyltransferase [bacterium]|nr:phosphoribosylglycinamide formyltransferase [bacterium]